MKRIFVFVVFAVLLFSFAAAEDIELISGKKVKIQEIRLESNEVTIQKGKPVKIKYTIMPKNATNKAVKWSSSNKKVATVSEKGKVKAKGYGVCKIKCSAKDGSKVFGECFVIVPAKASQAVYVGNNSTNVFHKAACRMVRRMLEINKVYLLRRDDAKLLGYDACGICCP